MNNPLVSIIIPTYNRGHVIHETLDSLLAQTHTNWECIIVDDGSTDNTKELINDYINKDARFQYFERPPGKPKGGNAARNFGFEKSKGDFVNWFDSDDLMHPEHLEKKIISLTNNEKSDYVICLSQNFNDSLSNLGWTSKINIDEDVFIDYIKGGCVILTFTPLWRKSILENIKLFDENIQQNQDLELYARIIFKNKKVALINEVLIYVRENNESITINNNKKQYHIKSYLEVKKRLLKLTSSIDNVNFSGVILNQILIVFRYLLKENKYDDGNEILNFIDGEYSKTRFKKYLFRFKLYYYLQKYLHKGETRFKKLLDIKIKT